MTSVAKTSDTAMTVTTKEEDGEGEQKTRNEEEEENPAEGVSRPYVQSICAYTHL